MITFFAFAYLVIGIYVFLFGLAIHNVWALFLRKKWKKEGEEGLNVSILMFYIYASIAISIRIACLVWQWVESPLILNADYVQQLSKICVGLV